MKLKETISTVKGHIQQDEDGPTLILVDTTNGITAYFSVDYAMFLHVDNNGRLTEFRQKYKFLDFLRYLYRPGYGALWCKSKC